jgi:chromosome segregation ATPase
MNSNSNSNNASQNNDLLFNAKIPISESEDDKTQYNQEPNYNQNQINKHLIYKKGAKKLSIPKKKFEDGSISESTFLEKNNKSDSNRLLLKKYQSEVERLTNKIDDLKKKLFEEKKLKLDLQEELNYVKLEKEKLSKINNIEIEKTQERNISLEEQNKKLIIKNEDLQKKLDEYSPKIWQYDQVNEKYKKLVEEHRSLLTTNQTLNELLNENKIKREDIDSDYQKIKLENKALSQNNESLKKDLEVNKNKVIDQDEKIKDLENEIRDMRKMNQNYIEKLTDKNLNIDNTYKDKLNKDLENMRKNYETDLSNLRKQYDDLTEKKTSYLKEERDEYKAKCNKYEKMIKEKDESLNLVKNELFKINTNTKEQMSSLKLQLNAKIEELNSLKLIYDDKLSGLKIIKNDNEALKEKNDLLRNEMIKNQSDYKAELAEYKAQISVLSEKLKSYDRMEDQLDNVINGSPDVGENDNQEIMHVIKDIPTTNKRRINQCLNLANKVKELSVENEKLRLINDKINNELREANDHCNLYKGVADQVKQPTSILITNLQQKEMEIYKLKQENKDLELEKNQLKAQCESLQETIDKMKNEIQTLVNNRKKIDDLQMILNSYIRDEKKGLNNYNDIENLNTHLSNFNSNFNNSLNKYSTQQDFYKSNNNIFNFSNTQYSYDKPMIPERDINSGMVTQTPDWYKKLKKKK